jgi:glycerol kinase
MVPAFAGLGEPHWDPYARGTITGLTGATTAGHLARAALEGIAHQVADVVEAMRQDAGLEVGELRADGGAAVNDLLLQLQADLLGVRVVRPEITETTALGAAYLAGLAVGYWEDLGALERHWRADRVLEPAMGRDEARKRRARWQEAVARARGWEAAEGGRVGPTAGAASGAPSVAAGSPGPVGGRGRGSGRHSTATADRDDQQRDGRPSGSRDAEGQA